MPIYLFDTNLVTLHQIHGSLADSSLLYRSMLTLETRIAGSLGI